MKARMAVTGKSYNQKWVAHANSMVSECISVHNLVLFTDVHAERLWFIRFIWTALNKETDS
jgi:hypothetical protein